MRGSETDHLEWLVSFLKTLHHVRSYVDASADSLLPRELNLQNDIRVLCLNIVHTVNQCLVHIENQDFLVLGIQRLWQVDQFVLYGLNWDDGEIVFDKVQGLQSVIEMLSM